MAGTPGPDRLTLASGSPARRELLTRAGYAFTVEPAGIDEPTGEGVTDPRQLVAHIAWLKAAAVAPRVPGGLVLAADTLGWVDGGPVSKPADRADARRIIRLLAGREHELWTGVCLWRRPDDMQVTFQEVSRVAVAPMTDAQIEAYLDTRQWEGCSGAYAIKEEGDPYLRVVSGTVSNVIGLPMETLETVFGWFR